MGVLWNDDGQEGWEPTFLDKSLVVLSIRTLKPVSRANRHAPVLLQMAATYALIVSEKTKFRINGQSLPTGLRLLEDRDLLETQAGICGFYSAEKRQIVFRFQDETGQCPRCRLKIEGGCTVVAWSTSTTIDGGDSDKGLLVIDNGEQEEAPEDKEKAAP